MIYVPLKLIFKRQQKAARKIDVEIKKPLNKSHCIVGESTCWSRSNKGQGQNNPTCQLGHIFKKMFVHV